ncbi:hypothetical protein AAZR23_00850 [Morganella sp. Je.2.23]|uniref:hypothetical protein n=1 Tax=Morganella sp. Je.2.23 TaxID=3142840 RepID=UPI003DA80F94
MDKAYCTFDHKEWDANSFSNLSDSDIQDRKGNLLCPGCHGDAWYRKASYGNESPHFCAHHAENGCQYGTQYEAVGEGDSDSDRKIPGTDDANGIVLSLGTTRNEGVDISSAGVTSEGNVSGQKFVSGHSANDGQKYPEQASLKQMLLRLVKSGGGFYADKCFSMTSDGLEGLPESGSELFVNFSDVVHRSSINENESPLYDGKRRIYWGFISDVRQSNDGKVWLNAGDIRKGLSIKLPENAIDEFRKRFRVEGDFDILEGCHAIVIGTCIYASTGKPIITCSDLNYITLRRYKAD